MFRNDAPLAVNVAIIGAPFDELAVGLSEIVCQDSIGSSNEYLLQRCCNRSVPADKHRGYAHCTLAQLFLSSQNVQRFVECVSGASAALVARFRESRVPTVDVVSLHEGPPFVTAPVEYRLPSLVIAKTLSIDDECAAPSFMQSLHDVIAEACRDVPMLENGTSHAFAASWPGNEASIAWANDYLTKSSHEHYFPHITLGASRSAIDTIRRLEKETGPSQSIDLLRQSKYWDTEKKCVRIPASQLQLVVSHMGNFCTCHRILSVVSLL